MRAPLGRDRLVIAFTGDGSFTMMMGDFVTLVQNKLPVKVVVMKNNTLGLIKWEQMLYLGNPNTASISLRSPIGLTIGRRAAQEFTFPESPFGAASRVLEKVAGGTGKRSSDDEHD